MIPLSRLRPGTKFLQPNLQIEGLLVKVNDCRAVVRLERPMQDVEFTDPDGNVRSFQARRSTDQSWGPSVPVVPLSVDPNFESETIMAKKAAAKKAAKKAAPKAKSADKPKPAKKAAKPAAEKKAGKPKAATESKPKAATPAGDAKPKKLSQLDAAVQVLKSVGRPMNCTEMVQAMAERGLWTSPGGKTPAATLYAAIGREITNKGGESRFIKIDKGTFGLS